MQLYIERLGISGFDCMMFWEKRPEKYLQAESHFQNFVSATFQGADDEQDKHFSIHIRYSFIILPISSLFTKKRFYFFSPNQNLNHQRESIITRCAAKLSLVGKLFTQPNNHQVVFISKIIRSTTNLKIRDSLISQLALYKI